MPFSQGYAPGMPGIGQSTYARGRAIWLGLAGVRYAPAGAVISSYLSRDPDNSETGGNETEPMQGSGTGSNIIQPPNAVTSYPGVLRAGLLMGKITTVTNSLGVLGQYRNSIIAVSQAAWTAAGHTTITVTAAQAAELARLIALGQTSFTVTAWDTVNSAVVQGAITGVSATATTFTISSFTPASSGAYAAGFFIGAADGSQNPITFVDEEFGLNVVDVAGNSLQGNNYNSTAVYAAPFPRVPVAGGVVNTANLINYPSTTNTGYANLRTWIKSQLQSSGQAGLTTPTYGGDFDFSDTY